MGQVEFELDGKKDSFYIDNGLDEKINKQIKPDIEQKDSDVTFIVDGNERVGKSVFAMQLAKKCDPNFCIERVCLTPNSFRSAILAANKGECVIYDEAHSGFSAKRTMSKINKLLVDMMMEIGQKNLYVIVVLPTIFMLEKYVAIFRARGLFHIYKKGNNRGYWCYFGRQKKKMLYILGKKLLSYSKPQSNFRGRFLDKYVVNEQAYRDKKLEALRHKGGDDYTEELSNKQQAQRNILIYALTEFFGVNKVKIKKILDDHGSTLNEVQIFTIIKEMKEHAKTMDMEYLESKEAKEKYIAVLKEGRTAQWKKGMVQQ